MCKELLCITWKKSLSYTIFSTLWLVITKYWFKRLFKVVPIMQTNQCQKIMKGGASSSWHNVHTHHLTCVMHESQSLSATTSSVMISSSSWLLKNIYSIQKVGWPPEKKNWSETNYNETKLGDFTLIILRDIFSHRISTETIFYLNSEWVRGLSIEIHGVYVNFWQFQVKISLSCAFQLYWFIRTRCVAQVY